MVSFKTILQEGSQRQNINNGHDCVPIKLYLHKQALGQMWPSSCSLLTTELARFNCCSDSCITKVSFSSNRTSVNNLMWSGCFTVSGTQATCLVFLPYCVVQDGMSIPTFKPAGRGKRADSSLQYATQNCTQFCLYPIGQNLVTWPSLAAREAGRCSLQLGSHGPGSIYHHCRGSGGWLCKNLPQMGS